MDDYDDLYALIWFFLTGQLSSMHSFINGFASDEPSPLNVLLTSWPYTSILCLWFMNYRGQWSLVKDGLENPIQQEMFKFKCNKGGWTADHGGWAEKRRQIWLSSNPVKTWIFWNLWMTLMVLVDKKVIVYWSILTIDILAPRPTGTWEDLYSKQCFFLVLIFWGLQGLIIVLVILFCWLFMLSCF